MLTVVYNILLPEWMPDSLYNLFLIKLYSETQLKYRIEY